MTVFTFRIFLNHWVFCLYKTKGKFCLSSLRYDFSLLRICHTCLSVFIQVKRKNRKETKTRTFLSFVECLLNDPELASHSNIFNPQQQHGCAVENRHFASFTIPMRHSYVDLYPKNVIHDYMKSVSLSLEPEKKFKSNSLRVTLSSYSREVPLNSRNWWHKAHDMTFDTSQWKKSEKRAISWGR